MDIKYHLYSIVNSFTFITIINTIIIVNSVLIGVETFAPSPEISLIQNIILLIFTLEVVMRYFGKKTIKEYISNGWNIFDVVILMICFIPETIFLDSQSLIILRVVRLLRILRMLKVFPELILIINVLLKSLRSLFYTCLLLIIFMYIYAVMGVILFKGLYHLDMNSNVHIDPYGTIAESFFTLFRVMTGDDWTDIRYNLLASNISEIIVTSYHISWVVLSTFLLINLVVGAVVNNYEEIMNDHKKSKNIKNKENINLMHEKIDSLNEKLNKLLGE